MALRARGAALSSLRREAISTGSRIRIGLSAKIIINLFTLCDGINALTGRRYLQDRPYA